jgi:hypothetical protein
MVPHVLFVQILKFGVLQNLLVFVLMEIGTDLLVLNVQQTKFGTQLL